MDGLSFVSCFVSKFFPTSCQTAGFSVDLSLHRIRLILYVIVSHFALILASVFKCVCVCSCFYVVCRVKRNCACVFPFFADSIPFVAHQ